MKIFYPLIVLLSFAATSSAVTVGFVEEFEIDGADWFHDRGNAGETFVDYQMSGGPDGSSYVEGAFNFINTSPPLIPQRGNSVIVFRAREDLSLGTNSSDGAFIGNWLAEGVTGVSFSMRHDAADPTNGNPIDLSVFVRLTNDNNSPAAVIESPISVPANQWTKLTYETFFGNPFLTLTGPPQLYPAIFSDVTRLQIGVSIPPSLVSADQTVTFGLDKVALIPEPSSKLLCAMSLIVALGCFVVRARRFCPVA